MSANEVIAGKQRFDAALTALINGRTVRRAAWSNAYVLRFNADKSHLVLLDPDHPDHWDVYGLFAADLLATDWEIVDYKLGAAN